MFTGKGYNDRQTLEMMLQLIMLCELMVVVVVVVMV
jgi:hypothetical protein